ncbi:concanavalin A-like lectin/glucanase domain-containing protein [Ilyonectria destructans]|nr:concanavalin A-like lectin/glucanase domain-containing protein [Ilyonectria destructans]
MIAHFITSSDKFVPMLWDCEIIGHSVPSLDWSPQYNCRVITPTSKEHGLLLYQQRPMVLDWLLKFGKSHVYTAPEASGPWAMASIIDTCYYDCGLHIDDDDKTHRRAFLCLPGRSLVLPMQLAILKEIASIRRMIPTTYGVAQWTETDRFEGNELGVAWEWNHNPDETGFSIDDGLTLFTATIADDIFSARNTLTRRGHGPSTVATIWINFSQMANGDRCGLAAFRDESSSIGIERSEDSYAIVETESFGSISATIVIDQDSIWLWGTMDPQARGTKKGSFSYSIDGVIFMTMGSELNLNAGWKYFPGYRWGIFNHATQALGGSVLVTEFSQVQRAILSNGYFELSPDRT